MCDRRFEHSPTTRRTTASVKRVWVVWLVMVCCGGIGTTRAQPPLHTAIDTRAAAVAEQVTTWRRDIHQHPELSNREFRTAKLVADALRSFGLAVQTEVAHTGVVGVLVGGEPGGVVALRADMDALPVAEATDVSFASTARAEYNGQDVGVMHACGHDAHVAILLGVAEVLSGVSAQIPGTVKFIFQPAEEGAPNGEEGGASLMIVEGALEDPAPEAIFGLHVIPDWDVGAVAFREGGMMASSDRMQIVVHGQQTHGAKPWLGVDPIVVSSQIVMALQTIASRQLDVTKTPSIITVGSIHGGTRFNIIPDEVKMEGTIRTFDSDVRTDIHERIRRTVEAVAIAGGASADVWIGDGTPVTFNDPTLTRQMTPTLQRVVGSENVRVTGQQTWAEDFSCYQQEIPGFFFYLGVRTPGADPATFPPNHSPRFVLDEDALVLGVRLLANLAVDYLDMASNDE